MCTANSRQIRQIPRRTETSRQSGQLRHRAAQTDTGLHKTDTRTDIHTTKKTKSRSNEGQLLEHRQPVQVRCPCLTDCLFSESWPCCFPLSFFLFLVCLSVCLSCSCAAGAMPLLQHIYTTNKETNKSKSNEPVLQWRRTWGSMFQNIALCYQDMQAIIHAS